MTDLVYIINLTLGDWSHDGHNITVTEVIKSNLSIDEIASAYKKGSKKLKVNLTKDICAGYEENTISFVDFKKFIDAGFLKKIDENTDFSFSEEEINSIKKEQDIEYVGTELFTELYLFTVYVGNELFQYSMAENETNNINIGGYGLLGN